MLKVVHSSACRGHNKSRCLVSPSARLYTLAQIEQLAKQWRDENDVTNDAQWVVSHLIAWLGRREKEGDDG